MTRTSRAFQVADALSGDGAASMRAGATIAPTPSEEPLRPPPLSKRTKESIRSSARQHAPCASAAGDFWVGRAQQNKAEYARAHGMQLVLASALFDGEYELSLIHI